MLIKKLMAVILLAGITFFIAGQAFAQNSSLQSNQPPLHKSAIEVSKKSSSKVIISNNTLFVDEFAANYRISGTLSDIQHSASLIMSSIVDDFTNATTGGYVKLTNKSDTTPGFGLANPFASTERIQEKIKEAFDKSILEANAKTGSLVISCNFGSVLDLFSCSVTRQDDFV